MALYRASPNDGVAWVTGASTGIGRQVALDLARQGYAVAATARGEDDLATLSAESAALSGRIQPFACDLTDEAATARTLAAIERDLGPVVLAVLNAGTYHPTHIDKLSVENFTRTYEVNVFGAVHCLVPLVAAMRRRGKGQIMLTGSVSGYFGLPSAAAYGASKAALNNMVWALKHDLDKLDIRIQISNPGFVDTPLTEKNRFPMPALMPVDKAAERMVRALRTGGTEVTFPRRFTWALKALGYLPLPAAHFIVNRMTGWNKRPLKEPSE